MDRKLAFSSFGVEYAFKSIRKEYLDSNDAKVIEDNTSNIGKHKAACFRELLSLVAGTDDYYVDLDIYFFKFNEKNFTYNMTIFSYEQICDYLKYLESIFDVELQIKELKDQYHIKVQYTSYRSKIVLLLSMIRFLYEFPFFSCLYIASEYHKQHEDISFFSILNHVFYIFDKIRYMPGGHFYGVEFVPKIISDDELKEIINQRHINSYDYTKFWSYREEPFDLDFIRDYIGTKKTSYSIVTSIDSIFNGELYNLLVEPLDRFIKLHD